jgi:hypothetical protein
MDRNLYNIFNISSNETVNKVCEENAHDEIYQETNKEIHEEINGNVYEIQGVYEDPSKTNFFSSIYDYTEPFSMVQPMFPSNQQDNNHQLANGDQGYCFF